VSHSILERVSDGRSQVLNENKGVNLRVFLEQTRIGQSCQRFLSSQFSFEQISLSTMVVTTSNYCAVAIGVPITLLDSDLLLT
jgi:hypothetical protein